MELKSAEPKIERSFELERIIFFSDAVIAIAITLLAIELRVPEIVESANAALDSQQLWQAIVAEGPRLLAFTLSFYIIGSIWISHHRYFRYIKQYDDALIRINLVWLFFVVLLSFTTALLGEYGYLQSAIVIYALNLICVGIAGAWLWYHASHNHHLIDADLDSNFIRRMQTRAFATPFAGLVVILATFFVLSIANFGWFTIFLFYFLVERYYRKPNRVK